MKYHDVTVPIHPAMPVFQGDPPVEISRFLSIEKGDAANVSSLRMGAHTGTHVDAPLHFVDGARGVDGIPLETLIGPARVVDLAEAREISSQTLADIDLKGVERILFKTSNSSLWSEGGFKKDFVYITGDAAEALVNAGIKLVGIDYLSVEKFDAATPSAHIALLEAGIVILEGLNLSKVGPGEFHLICLPLLISGCDGSPCRAVLVEE